LPGFRSEDVFDQIFDFEGLPSSSTDLAILHFFSVNTSQDVAVRLSALNQSFPIEQLSIAAVGLEEQEADLKEFAAGLGIRYYVLEDSDDVQAKQRFGPFPIMPTTLVASRDRLLLKTIEGSGKTEASVINYVAQQFLRRGQGEDAQTAAQVASAEGEDGGVAQETIAFAMIAEGKLDDADAAFTEMDSISGRAAVALNRGDYDQAIEIAKTAPEDDGYAKTVLGQAFLKAGKLDEASKAFGEATQRAQADWQRSDALVGAGRMQQQTGDLAAAVDTYRQASSLDNWNIVALSNEGSAHRALGDLDSASAVLQRADGIGTETNRSDALVAMMLRQVVDQLEKANDLQRLEFIRGQIADLSERYEQLKAEGRAEPTDPWTSRPMVLAFLAPESSGGVFFERAGTDLALKREVEMRLNDHARITIVDRDELDMLLQELNLGSSDLADENTQLTLGHVYAAQQLGFIEFGYLGSTPRMNVRTVDTETTRIATQFSRDVAADADLDALIGDVVNELTTSLANDMTLQALLIADGAAEGTVDINLGNEHGVQAGTRFAVIQEGEPSEVGGRTVPGKPIMVGTIEVAEVLDGRSTCNIVNLNDGVELANEMRARELPAN
jgi:tetratricopeptide (TPR) repeat protein